MSSGIALRSLSALPRDSMPDIAAVRLVRLSQKFLLYHGGGIVPPLFHFDAFDLVRIDYLI